MALQNFIPFSKHFSNLVLQETQWQSGLPCRVLPSLLQHNQNQAGRRQAEEGRGKGRKRTR